MKYWDASAIVPLLVAEQGTALVREWLEEDSAVVTWALTAVEVTGAIERRARQGLLTNRNRERALDRVHSLVEAWDEVHELSSVRMRALHLLARHSLRAADALQLGAANLVAEGQPASMTFVCLDRNLADAASREGFEVQTWPAE